MTSPGVKKVQPSRYIPAVRLMLSLSLLAGWCYQDQLQRALDALWLWMCSQAAYRSVVFESVFTATLGGFITGMYWLAEHNPYWNVVEKYSNRAEKMATLGPLGLAKWAFGYMYMFLLLDPITPKRYGHVDPRRYEQRAGYVHAERLLPERAPSLGALAYESVVGLLLYDAIFFCIHYALHNVPALYRHVHRHHHEQQAMTAYETDHLHPVERFLLVITGNESMRLVAAHPLSRNLFNVWLIYLLFNNHCGLDLPLSLEKVVPFGVMYGPADHELHHMRDGTSHYQPFFRYLDDLLLWLREWRHGGWALADGRRRSAAGPSSTEHDEPSPSDVRDMLPEMADSECSRRLSVCVSPCQ